MHLHKSLEGFCMIFKSELEVWQSDMQMPLPEHPHFLSVNSLGRWGRPMRVPRAAASAQQETLWTSESEHIPLKSIQNKIQNLTWLRHSRGTHWSTGSRLGLLCLDPYEVPGIDVTSLLLWSPLGTLPTPPTSSCCLPPHRLLAATLALLAQPSSGGAWTPWPQHVHVTSHVPGPRHSNLFTWAWGPQQRDQHEPVCAEQRDGPGSRMHFVRSELNIGVSSTETAELFQKINLIQLPGESPWTEELGGLQSLGSQRVRHDWVSTQVTSPKHYFKILLYQIKTCL